MHSAPYCVLPAANILLANSKCVSLHFCTSAATMDDTLVEEYHTKQDPSISRIHLDNSTGHRVDRVDVLPTSTKSHQVLSWSALDFPLSMKNHPRQPASQAFFCPLFAAVHRIFLDPTACQIRNTSILYLGRILH